MPGKRTGAEEVLTQQTLSITPVASSQIELSEAVESQSKLKIKSVGQGQICLPVLIMTKLDSFVNKSQFLQHGPGLNHSGTYAFMV